MKFLVSEHARRDQLLGSVPRLFGEMRVFGVGLGRGGGGCAIMWDGVWGEGLAGSWGNACLQAVARDMLEDL
jgi:hypothetical protein